MFDVGFAEVFLILVVALLVVGPQRLPHVAAKAGRWYRQARRMVESVRGDFEREFNTQELRDILNQQESEIRKLRASVHGETTGETTGQTTGEASDTSQQRPRLTQELQELDEQLRRDLRGGEAREADTAPPAEPPRREGPEPPKDNPEGGDPTTPASESDANGTEPRRDVGL
jgi:sec-independent protein translocase protein TatB